MPFHLATSDLCSPPLDLTMYPTSIAGCVALLGILADFHAQAELPDLPPTTLEIDLIFPRMNATHRRAYRFPIVFAVHGAKNIWPYHLRLSFFVHDTRLEEEHPDWQNATDGGSNIGFDVPHSDQISPEFYTKGDVPGGEDPYFYIGSTGIMLNSTSTDYYLVWKAMMPANCTAGDGFDAKGSFLEGATPRYSLDVPMISGMVRWKVSDDAPMDIEPPDNACPDVESTLEDSNSTNTLRLGGTVTDAKCIYYDDENLRPNPNPCAAKADSALAAKVTQTMLKEMICKPDDVWPADSRGHCFDQPGYCIPTAGNPCPGEDESRGTVRFTRGKICLVVAIGVGLFLI